MSSLPGHVTCQRGREKFGTVWLHHPFQEQLERHIHPKRTDPTATVDEIRDATSQKLHMSYITVYLFVGQYMV